MALRLVSFDLDGTLIHPAIFNAVSDVLGFADKLEETTRAYFEGRMTADETFHADYRHFVGREVAQMQDALVDSPAWTPGIRKAIARIHEAGARVVVTTDQPDFLACMTQRLFGVDDLVCTKATVSGGRVTETHDAQFDKWANLQRYLEARDIEPRDVAHVGNGSNDVPVFERVGYSVAVNPMNERVRMAADAVVDPLRDLEAVADLVLAKR